MKIVLAILIFGAAGTLGVRIADIDINRVKRLPNVVPDHSSYRQIRRPSQGSFDDQIIIRSNDYDDHSSWYQHQRAPIPVLHDSPTTADSKTPLHVYQPREDPRLFYQSDTYLKKYGKENINDVSFIYPGRDVIQAGEPYEAEKYSRLRSETDDHSTAAEGTGTCVRCPHDRTLVAKASFGRVVLQNPVLQACSGRRAPRSTKFLHMYGPKFGSLLEQGSHMVIGQIIDGNKKLQLCKMQLHVVVQGCATPKYLVAHCWDHNTQCNFTCRNSLLELSGPSTQTCGDDLKWKGALPVCKAQTWCVFPPPPEHGRVSCQGTTAGDGAGLIEGTRCRVRCARGYRSLRSAPVCRRGAWTHALACQPKRNVRKN